MSKMSILTEYVLNERAIWAEQLRLYMVIKQAITDQDRLEEILTSCDFFDYQFLIRYVHRDESLIPMSAKQIDAYISKNLHELNVLGIEHYSHQDTILTHLSSQPQLTDDIVKKYDIRWDLYSLVNSCPKVSIRLIKELCVKYHSDPEYIFQEIIDETYQRCNISLKDRDIVDLEVILKHPNVKWNDFWEILPELDQYHIEIYLMENPNSDIHKIIQNIDRLNVDVYEIIKNGNVRYSDVIQYTEAYPDIKKLYEYLKYDNFQQLDEFVKEEYYGSEMDHMPNVSKKDYLNYHGIHKKLMIELLSIEDILDMNLNIASYRPSTHLVKLKTKRKLLIRQLKKYVGVQYYKYLYNPEDGVELLKTKKELFNE